MSEQNSNITQEKQKAQRATRARYDIALRLEEVEAEVREHALRLTDVKAGLTDVKARVARIVRDSV